MSTRGFLTAALLLVGIPVAHAQHDGTELSSDISDLVTSTTKAEADIAFANALAAGTIEFAEAPPVPAISYAMRELVAQAAVLGYAYADPMTRTSPDARRALIAAQIDRARRLARSASEYPDIVLAAEVTELHYMEILELQKSIEAGAVTYAALADRIEAGLTAAQDARAPGTLPTAVEIAPVEGPIKPDTQVGAWITRTDVSGYLFALTPARENNGDAGGIEILAISCYYPHGYKLEFASNSELERVTFDPDGIALEFDAGLNFVTGSESSEITTLLEAEDAKARSAGAASALVQFEQNVDSPVRNTFDVSGIGRILEHMSKDCQ